MWEIRIIAERRSAGMIRAWRMSALDPARPALGEPWMTVRGNSTRSSHDGLMAQSRRYRPFPRRKLTRARGPAFRGGVRSHAISWSVTPPEFLLSELAPDNGSRWRCALRSLAPPSRKSTRHSLPLQRRY
jgi:hypothetical protein